MQEAPEKVRTNMQSGGKFIDTLIRQWTKRTGSNISFQSKEMAESSSMQEDKQQARQIQERVIQDLKRKLKESQEAEASLAASLEAEARNKEEIQTKLNATWESIETITEYFNYISESLASFQQHRANLTAIYDNIILKQQEAIQKIQLSNTKSKDLENRVAQLKNESLLQEGRLREAMAERNKLQKQLENFQYELQSQKNELANTHAEEKLILVKEQQQLMLEYENLQSRLQTVEKEKCDIAKSVAQLENKLLLKEEKMQEALEEQNKLQKQMKNTECEFYTQKNELAITHAEEKKILVEEQQRLLSECENLQSRINKLEQDKSNIIEAVTQKDALLSKLQDEISMYKNQIKTMIASKDETYAKYVELTEKQNIWEQEIRIKTEKIQDLETTLSAIKQRETSLINDINRIEKKLSNETDCSKNLKNKLLNAQRDLQLAQKQTAEIQKTLKETQTVNERTNIEHQQQLKALQREKEEIIKRESMKIKNAEVLHENTQAKHFKELSALKSNYETQLLELKRSTNDIRKENSVINLTEMRMENSNLRKNYDLIIEYNDLQKKLTEITEILQMKSIENQNPKFEKENQKQPKEQKNDKKRKYEISTSRDLSDDEKDKPLSQLLNRAHSIERESQKEQETEVTSAGKKFFKSRSAQLRTYAKGRQNL